MGSAYTHMGSVNSHTGFRHLFLLSLIVMSKVFLSFCFSVLRLVDSVKKLSGAERRKILNTLYEMEEERANDEALKESIGDIAVPR